MSNGRLISSDDLNTAGFNTVADAWASSRNIDLNVLPGGTTKYWRGDKSWQVLDKIAVGLNNVDNTSDLSKPVSTATQTALTNLNTSIVNITNLMTGALTLTALTTTSIPGTIMTLITSGYYSAGDGGGAHYMRVGSQPSHAGKFQSADGAWWELSEIEVDPRMFGAIADASNDDGSDASTFTDNAIAINNAMYYTSLRGGSARPASTSTLDGLWGAGARVLVFRPGATRNKSVYGITGRIQVYTGTAVVIGRGAEVRAMTGFAAKSGVTDAVSAMFEGATATEVAGGAQRVRNVLILLNGNINCNKLADVGIQGHLGNNWLVRGNSGYVSFPKLIGVRFGISSNSEAMFECYIDHLVVQFFRTGTDTGGTNDSNSAAVDYAKCSDSTCSFSIAIGGRRGFRSQSGDNTFLRCHAWTNPGCGPMVAAYVNFSSGVKYIACIADGVQGMATASISGSGGKCAAFECYGSAQISDPTFLHSGGTGSYAGEANLVYTSITAGSGVVSVTGTATVKLLNSSPKMGALLNGDQRVVRMSAQLTLLNGADYDRTLGAYPLGISRNAAPNRDFSMWQRGDGPNSCIGTSGQVIRFCDRWWTQTGSTTGARTLRRKRITDTNTAGISHASVLTVAQTADPADGYYFSLSATLPPEDLMDAAGKYMTVAFKARLASGTMPSGFTASAYCVYDSGSNASATNSPASATITSTGAFQLVTLRTLIPSIDGKTINPAYAKLQVNISLPITGVWEVDIAEMMILFGDVWQDYQVPSRESVEDEALRYFERVNFRTINGVRGVSYKRKARTTPSLSLTVGTLTGSYNSSDVLVTHTAQTDSVLDVLAEL